MEHFGIFLILLKRWNWRSLKEEEQQLAGIGKDDLVTQKGRILLLVILTGCALCACKGSADRVKKAIMEERRTGSFEEKAQNTGRETEVQWEKGYELLLDPQEEKEARRDCITMLERISGIYENADKGKATNVILNEKTILAMQKEIMNTGYPVATSVIYSNMENYERMDTFLTACAAGNEGSQVVWEICADGGIGRKKFIFDGTDMYMVSTRGSWRKDNKPEISYSSNSRIEAWKYTEKGWFCYELCVPKPPEVTEIVDGSCLLRVKPMTREQREMSKRCVKGLGYQGNNVLCSDWDAEHMEKLDFNGMYEYLYAMKYGDSFSPEKDLDGIPKEKFESLIMEYFPITAEQIRKYAAFDEEKQTYCWEKLGCFNYAPSFFDTSLPEVTNIQANKDGTVTLTVDAVCDMVICDDAVITHELTVRFAEDGSFQYLGNEILDGGITQIPDYQYRIRK